MPSEVFRFVILRGTLRGKDQGSATGTVPLTTDKPSPLLTELANLRASGGSRAELEGAAAKYVGSDLYALRQPLPIDIPRLDAWFSGQPAHLPVEAFKAGVAQTLDSDIESLVASSAYAETRQRVADSVLALTVMSSASADTARLARFMRLSGLMESVVAGHSDAVQRDRVSAMRILLPADVFPLPPTVNPKEAETEAASEAEKKQREQEEATRAALAELIANSRQSIGELGSALRADTNDLRQAASRATSGAPRRPSTRVAPAASSDANAAATDVSIPPRQPVSAGELSSKGAGRLSDVTNKALDTLGVSADFVDVPYTVQSLESVIANASAKLFASGASHTLTRVGDRWIPGRASDGLAGLLDTWRSPGPCVQAAADDPGGEGGTAPATTMSTLRPIGIADLLLVRQQVKRYDLGEIAHVENVMIGESRRRMHREKTQTTETVTVETETTTEESHDLETTDRFELQQESDAVIKDETSRNIALSISASYGPFASGTANINTLQGESKETTTKNAMNYARDVTDKAVKKVQARVLERRTVTTVHEVDDVSHHDFDNAHGPAHIQGIYRWLDKIYEAQVTSYGLRHMFELVVPEPSAFYRYALTSVPPEGLMVEKPDLPGYCQHPSGAFVPLVPGDLVEGNYQFWVAKYGVTGVEPPPPLHRTIGITLSEKPAAGDDFLVRMNNELQVPAGYAAERAWVGGQQIVYANPLAFVSFHVGRTPVGVNSTGAMSGEDGALPVVGYGYKVASVAVTIEVLCTRTAEALASWQLATFTSIMGAYNDLRSQYDAALARLELNAQSNTGIAGKNPDTNREIERRELKRASLTMLTNQQFDTFDAMRRGVPPDGYPQMNIAEAMAEGGYIKFFEQAFEWTNMSYLFYPYFWARKSQWPDYLHQDDADPLFGQFLQAGAARLQVPVTPGYEQALRYLLVTGKKPWEEDDSAFDIEGSLYKSMVDEIINEQLGAFSKGEGTIAVTQADPAVTGSGTAFDPDLHLDRDIMIANRVYRVLAVGSPTQLTLDRPYQDPTHTGLSYSFGSRLVGDPWEVKVPTSLVYLQPDNALPDFMNT
jgi:hypothetical protein